MDAQAPGRTFQLAIKSRHAQLLIQVNYLMLKTDRRE